MSGEEIKIKNEKALDDNPCQANSDWFVQKGESTSDNIYPPRYSNGFTPLVNGKEAFTQLRDAIEKAEKSIDIISWGFDPALMLEGYHYKGERIGDLLRRKAKEKNIEVRILIWEYMAPTLSPDTAVVRVWLNPLQKQMIDEAITEDNTPTGIKVLFRVNPALKMGYAISDWVLEKLSSSYNEQKLMKKISGLSLEQLKQKLSQLNTLEKSEEVNDYLLPLITSEYPKKGTSLPIDEIEDWFSAYGKKAVTKGIFFKDNYFPNIAADDLITTLSFYLETENQPITEQNKVSFRTRDPKWSDVSRSLDNSKVFPEYQDSIREIIHKAGPTDHQKMVLIDYETPQKAIGFVMGHNMHKDYYDNSWHEFTGHDCRWPGFRPWQDISSMVQGSVLYDLNDNFCKAWDKASNEGLYDKRSTLELKPESFSLNDTVPKNDKIQYLVDAAQICRTEPSYDEQTILSLYKKAVGNAKSYLYMENQYFRYGALADYLKEISKTRKEGAHSCNGSKKDMYLFVVTNQPNSEGEVPYTFDMLTRLGSGDQLPKVQIDVVDRYKFLLAQKAGGVKVGDEIIDEAPDFGVVNMLKLMLVSFELNNINKDLRKYEELYPNITQIVREDFKIEDDGSVVLFKKEEIKNTDNTEKAEDAITMKLADDTGLKVLIGALKSCIEVRDKKGGRTGKFYYTKVYVHSKLLIVDDAFLTLGSTNINTRSFKVDSELNIAVPNCQVAKETREKLWEIHAKEYKEGNSVQAVAENNHEHWKIMMNENWKCMNKKEQLLCSLTYLHDHTAEVPMIIKD